MADSRSEEWENGDDWVYLMSLETMRAMGFMRGGSVSGSQDIDTGQKGSTQPQYILRVPLKIAFRLRAALFRPDPAMESRRSLRLRLRFHDEIGDEKSLVLAKKANY